MVVKSNPGKGICKEDIVRGYKESLENHKGWLWWLSWRKRVLIGLRISRRLEQDDSEGVLISTKYKMGYWLGIEYELTSEGLTYRYVFPGWLFLRRRASLKLIGLKRKVVFEAIHQRLEKADRAKIPATRNGPRIDTLLKVLRLLPELKFCFGPSNCFCVKNLEGYPIIKPQGKPRQAHKVSNGACQSDDGTGQLRRRRRRSRAGSEGSAIETMVACQGAPPRDGCLPEVVLSENTQMPVGWCDRVVRQPKVFVRTIRSWLGRLGVLLSAVGRTLWR